MTPHNEAKRGEIAKTVLLPGDPLRAKFIAETYLEEARQVNGVRNMLAYTGTYKGKEVSVMGTGMGAPSIGIVAHELIYVYGCKNLIRVGSCGAMQEDLKLFDMILAQGACTDSSWQNQYGIDGVYSAISSWELLKKAHDRAEELGYPVHVGNILTGDVFYEENPDRYKTWQKMGVLAKEMESYALYATAARAGVHALTILTVSDSMLHPEETTAEQREKSFTDMMELALGLA
ncbi:MAG: purine-nucleoside phosphorylase [Tissierellia bacterium]|jgi:purine-nucleoside phosphorylase|nr:purine-nucleoside phosphorylase [Bacillota bacterium]NLK57899.1 purine-nucleoside phosphorylase [Tissierellia bacterium]